MNEQTMQELKRCMEEDYNDLLASVDNAILKQTQFLASLQTAKELLLGEDFNGYYFHFYNIKVFLESLEESMNYIN